MTTYTLDRAVVFVAPCGGLVAATVNGEDLPEFVRDHRGWRMDVMDSATVRASRWCTGADGCKPGEGRPVVIVDHVEHVCEACDRTFEGPRLPDHVDMAVCDDCSIPR